MDELIEQLKNRNSAAAYPTLQKLFFKLVRNHVRQNSGSDNDAADVFADTYMIVERWVAEGRYKEQGNFKSWFMNIARCQWINHLRKRPKWFLLPDDLGILLDRSDETTEEVWEAAERKEQQYEIYLECLDGLGSPCREVLTKFHAEKKSIREIAIEMGYYNPEKSVFDEKLKRFLTEEEKRHHAENVVKSTKSRCKTRLENCVQNHVNEG